MTASISVTVPAYIEVERGVFKSAMKCNYSEFVAGSMRETDPVREQQINRILRLKLETWRVFPRRALGEMVKEVGKPDAGE